MRLVPGAWNGRTTRAIRPGGRCWGLCGGGVQGDRAGADRLHAGGPGGTGRGVGRAWLTLIGGVVFGRFMMRRSGRVVGRFGADLPVLVSHGARHLVLIDSISPRRAPTAGRASEAEQMGAEEWAGFVDRFRRVAQLGVESRADGGHPCPCGGVHRL